MSKLTYEDKINLYTDKKGEMSIGSLSNKYKVCIFVNDVKQNL